MKMPDRKLFALMSMVALAFGAFAEVITIPENGTLTIGGAQADPYNKLTNYIVFEPGSTLVVTQYNAAVNIWATLIATNGNAFVECSDPSLSPTIEFNVFAYGAGSLTLRNMNQPVIGHTDHYPVLKLENLYSEGVKPIALKNSCVLSFPRQENCPWVIGKYAGTNIRLCGSDMYPDDDVITFDPDRGAVQLCNPAAIPAGKTVRANKDLFSISPLAVPDPEDGIVDRFGTSDSVATAMTGYVYSCNVELPGASTLTFTNSADLTFNGTISGYKGACGDIVLSGFKRKVAPVTLGGDNSGFSGRIYSTMPGAELVLSNAQAASHATLDMTMPFAVRVAENVPSMSLRAVENAGFGSSVQAPSGQTVSVGTFSGSLRAVGTGVEVGVVPQAGEVVSVGGEGSFVMEAESVLYQQVGYWFDFSRADTRFRIGEGATDAYLDREYASGQPFIERVLDWRHPDLSNCLWNRRLYSSTYDAQNMVYPFVSADTQNGLHYISMETSDKSRRLPFSHGTGYNTVASCEAQLVVMVFGAQYGGGYAMVATEEGAFGRTAANRSAGITTNTAHDVWQDGVKVNPTTATFKNGFQVMSVALDGLHFNGLGFRKDISTSPNQMSGQTYGEVLVFTNAVSEQVRLEAEYYLARKWGLEGQYSSAAVEQLKELRRTNPVRIAAAGDATIKAGGHTVSVGGTFAGTVNLDGGTLLVPDRLLPYTESDIPSAGRLYWADPDDRETVMGPFDSPFYNRQVSTACSNEVRVILDKSVRSLASTVGNPILYAVGDRRPTPIRQWRGLGPERAWLDFNDYADSSQMGNCLRFISCPDLGDASFKDGAYSAVSEMNVRTAFIVQDSARGGGSPLLSDVYGAASSGPKSRAGNVWTQTIYPGDLPAVLVNGENRLNGNVVDYTKGFLGGPEVFTVRATGTHNLPFIGCFTNTENGKKFGEIIGEVLLYNTALSDDQVKGIESYLMGKWIGCLPEGYADIRQATVTGTGTVQVAVGPQMPRIGHGFEGTVSVAADGDFSMTVDVDAGEVFGALDCPAATLDLPANCSITLNFTSKPQSDLPAVSYTLVDCAAGADGVDWNLAVGANPPTRGVFKKTGNRIVYTCLRTGLTFIFR